MRKPLFLVLAAAIALAVAYGTVQAADEPMPSVGQVAPGFTLPSQDGSQISLDSFKGKWVVLYFYPKDMTTGCTIEAHNFQRDQAQFEAKNAWSGPPATGRLPPPRSAPAGGPGPQGG